MNSNFNIDPIAKGLNNKLISDYPSFWPFLSELGQDLYFPKGIIEQSKQAAQLAKLYNSTIGIYTNKDGPVHLSEVDDFFSHLTPKEIYPYAPSSGRPNLRKLWQKKIIEQNHSLKNNIISTPIVTNGITHAANLASQMFLDKGQTIISPDLFWENYHLMLSVKQKLNISTFPLFNNNNRFNIDEFSKLLDIEFNKNNKIAILLNFPNNPSGYSLLADEQFAVVECIKQRAIGDKRAVIFIDDAYFGLFFDDKISSQSIFSRLAYASENILAVKLDGATKELFVWGFRIGFLTLGTKNGNDQLYKIVEQKISGLIRSEISSGSMPAQKIIESILQENTYKTEMEGYKNTLKNRANTLKEILLNNNFSDQFTYFPFNSGYFMCIKLNRPIAEVLRVKLLEEYQIGTISNSDHVLRIAFSSVEEQNLNDLINKIYSAAKQIS